MEAQFLFCKTATHKRHSKELCTPGIEPIVVRYRRIPSAKEPHKRDIQKSPIFLECSLSLYGSVRSLLQNSHTQRDVQESRALYSSNSTYYCIAGQGLFCKKATHKETFKRALYSSKTDYYCIAAQGLFCKRDKKYAGYQSDNAQRTS